VNSHLKCPITKEMFSDPVLLTGDGHTYERSAVEKWLSEHNTSPLTGAVLSETKLIPNFAVRGQVDELASATTEHSYRPSYVGLPVATLVVAGEKGKSKVVPKGKEHAEKQAGVSESQPSGSTLSSRDRALRKWVTHFNVPEHGWGPHRFQKGFFVHFKNKGWDNLWPLHRAAMVGDVDAIRALAAQGNRSVSQRMRDWDGCTPLHFAASYGQLKAVIELILLDADPFAQNIIGETPLNDAQREGHTAVVWFLRELAYRLRAEGPIPAILRDEEIVGPPRFDEENWGIVACPIYGYKWWGAGSYHNPIGLCCCKVDRKHETTLCTDLMLGVAGFSPSCFCYLCTFAFQPCGASITLRFPWLGDCPFSEQRVTQRFAEDCPCCLTRGDAIDRRGRSPSGERKMEAPILHRLKTCGRG